MGGCKSGAVCSAPISWPRLASQVQVGQVQLQLPLLYSPLEKRLLAPHRRVRRMHRPRLHLQLHHLPHRAARRLLGETLSLT